MFPDGFVHYAHAKGLMQGDSVDDVGKIEPRSHGEH